MKIILSLLALTALTIGLLGSCKKEYPKVSVTGVTLDKTTLEITVGDPDVKLTATVAPENATDKTVNWASDKAEVATVDNQGSVHAVAPGEAIITVTTTDGAKTATCTVTVKAALPTDALPGEFSVSTTKKVLFSKGNLVATINDSGAPTAWKFATNQYDYIGEGGANKTIGIAAGDIDLFGWSTDAASNNWGIHKKTSATDGFTTGNFNDWGKNIGDGNTWRTLSNDEWTYLFYTRTMTYNKSHYSNAMNGVTIGGTTYKGVFLYPDNYNGEVVSSGSMTWDQINAAGIVFLPAAGVRLGSDVSGVGVLGFYWSSTACDSDYAYGVFCISSSVGPGSSGLHGSGSIVRLITECQ